MIVVMYHYVRPDGIDLPELNYLNLDIFKKQLDYFQNNYGFISQEEFYYSIDANNEKDGVVLTFDDGLSDHYRYVLPELKKRNLWGIFYISTKYYIEEKKELLGVHRIHYLKAKYGAKKILSETLKLVDESMLDDENIGTFDNEIYKYSNYENDEKKLRRLFNYYIKYEHRDEILDKLMADYSDEKTIAQDWYLNIDELKELHQCGNIIGSHTVNHKVLSRLNYHEQKFEISESFNFLKSFLNLDKLNFCYPYGYDSSFNEDTLKILKELNVHNAVKFDNMIQKKNINRFEISRIDCNQYIEVLSE